METMHGKKELKPSPEENNKIKDRPIIDEFQHPPSQPFMSRSDDLYLDSCPQMVNKCSKQANAIVAAASATNNIVPNPIPEAVNNAFYRVCDIVFPILEKDSLPRFLRFLKEDGRGVCWRGMITPETFNHMMIDGSLKCAEAALKGEAGHRADPNCMNQYGHFPLHEAAESFNVDMIKLLLAHGALTSVRTTGTKVAENLLPLHVAVENTCLHKYLEDNLLPNVDHPDYPTKVDDNYIYKLIHLLCLPEMKIYLGTTRLLAENTDNLLDVIWNYAKDCKVVQTGIILMAAQKHIRRGGSWKSGVAKVDGFSTIINRIQHSITVEIGMFQSEENLQQQQAKVKCIMSTLLLVNIICQAGQELDAYIRSHSEASHAEILDGVSSILKFYGFCPTGEVINTENLCPYKFSMPGGELSNKNGSITAKRITSGVADLPSLGEKGGRKRLPRGWTHQYMWLSFFPYWRSVLASRSLVKVYPGHVKDDRKHDWGLGPIPVLGNSSTPTSNQNLGFSERIPQPPGMYQPKRAFGTAAMRFLKAEKVYSPIPNNKIGHLERIPQPGYYQPQRVLGTAAMRILKVLRKA